MAAVNLGDCAICGGEITAPNCRTTCGSEACQRALRQAKGRNREHRKRVTESDITAALEHQMRERARKCPLCDVTLTSRPHSPNSKELDHILPVCQGGTHTLGNVRIICRRCNQARPKDGSDFTGQLTLWAQSPGVISRMRTMCGNGLHPWIPANIWVYAKGNRGRGQKFCRPCRDTNRRQIPLKDCKCGATFPAPGRTLMCPDCTAAAGQQAAELHASGLTWAAVAVQTGYSTAEGARFAAKRTGYVPEARPPQPPAARPARLCLCGEPVPGSLTRCEACAEARAWQAVRMRESGLTLALIASELGYTSKTSVTNLMNTVTTIDPRTGGPRVRA